MPVCVGAFAIPGTWQQNEHILISLRAISMAEEIKAKELLIHCCIQNYSISKLYERTKSQYSKQYHLYRLQILGNKRHIWFLILRRPFHLIHLPSLLLFYLRTNFLWSSLGADEMFKQLSAKAVGKTLKGLPLISVPHSETASSSSTSRTPPIRYLRECGANDYSGFCHFNSHYPLHLFYYFVRHCFCSPHPLSATLPTPTVIVGWCGWQGRGNGRGCVCVMAGCGCPSPSPPRPLPTFAPVE